jgi:DNA polymerase III subunit epsilon
MLSGSDLSTCDFVAVDLETTGCRPGRNSIIEIGAVRFDATGVSAVFEKLVRPVDTIPRAVEDLTGITTSMVAAAPSVEVVIDQFRDFADGAVLVAHNYRFDLSFLDYEAERSWGAPLHRPVIDTLSVLRRLRPDLRRFSLGSLAVEYELPTTPDHRAGNDARATGELLIAVLPDLMRLGFTTVGDVVAFSGLSGQEALAQRLHLTHGIPDEPGVYLFRDEEGRVIYVGHAHSLRTRTRQYFYPGASTDALANDVDSVTAVRTPSQLDAMLLEHRLVDRHRPRYNPSAHQSRAGYLVKVDMGSPYPGLKVVESPRTRGRLIGPFTSRWAAVTLVDRLRSLYDLRRCARRLDARLAMTPCANRDAGLCPAPCVRVPDHDEYMQRLDLALSALDDDRDFRKRMVEAQRSAASHGHYEEAIRNRDGLRALDRALSSVVTIREASRRDAVLVEESDGEAVVTFVRGGLRAAVLRGTRESIDAKLASVVDRVYFSDALPVDPLRLTPEKIAEMLIIAGYDEADAHLEIRVTTAAETLGRIRRSLGLDRRTPRRRHGAVSGA